LAAKTYTARSCSGSAVPSGCSAIASIVVSSPQTSRRKAECAAVQYVDLRARAAAMVATSNRRRSMPPRTLRFSAFQAAATSGLVENAGA